MNKPELHQTPDQTPIPKHIDARKFALGIILTAALVAGLGIMLGDSIDLGEAGGTILFATPSLIAVPGIVLFFRKRSATSRRDTHHKAPVEADQTGIPPGIPPGITPGITIEEFFRVATMMTILSFILPLTTALIVYYFVHPPAAAVIMLSGMMLGCITTLVWISIQQKPKTPGKQGPI